MKNLFFDLNSFNFASFTFSSRIFPSYEYFALDFLIFCVCNLLFLPFFVNEPFQLLFCLGNSQFSSYCTFRVVTFLYGFSSLNVISSDTFIGKTLTLTSLLPQISWPWIPFLPDFVDEDGPVTYQL